MWKRTELQWFLVAGGENNEIEYVGGMCSMQEIKKNSQKNIPTILLCTK